MRESLQGLIDLTEFSEQDRFVLQKSADRTGGWADEYVAMFYDTLFGYPPTEALFKEGERPQREATIRNWYLQVVAGGCDDSFWSAQWQIGQLHIDRKIQNSYMLGMMHRTQQFFLDKCLATFDQEEALSIFEAFKRVTDVAAGIIAEGYHTPYAVLKVGA
jgi:hypothetical protein